MLPLSDLESSTVRERALLALASHPFLLLIAAGVALHERWSLVAATVLVALIVRWWLPYFGISFRAQREAYGREYLRTLKILPTEGHDVVIDVQHMVVGVLTLAMLGTTLAVTLSG